MKKLIVLCIIATLLLTLMTGCGDTANENIENEKLNIALENPLTLDFIQTSRHDDSVNKFSMTYDKTPQNSLAITNAMIEMMLSLGLENEMAGTAYAENNVLESLKPSYDKVPVMSETYPSKEEILANNVDFIIGWGGDFNDKGVGSLEWLNEKGIKVYIPRAVEADATVDSIYEDFSNLGKIFGASDKAEQVNANIKQKLEEVSQKTAQVDKKVKVMGYDSASNGAVVIGKGINNEIINLAQGENIFSDQEKAYPEVSWEEIVKRNPDAIIVLEYSVNTGGLTFEEKVKALKENSALKNVTAIKNNNFIKLELAELYPGERTPLTVEKLAKSFYPEKF
ncbi:MAG: ABC transporter substrate-binding protein [Proteocatella sp.]